MECGPGHSGEPLDAGACHQAAGLDAQKKTLGATERNEQVRADYRQRIQQYDADAFVIVDECGSNINLTPLYARARRGERAYGKVPRTTAKNTTLIASLTTAGLGPAMTLEGATDTAAFVVYIEQVLGPALVPGQVVVMDNLAAHKDEWVRAAIEARGCELWYLPAYSPDLSPIEEAFSKLKSLLRQAEARTREALEQAIAAAVPQITRENARGYFAHCGYQLTPAPAQ